MSRYDMNVSIATSGKYKGYRYWVRKTAPTEKMWWWTAYVKVSHKSFMTTEDVDKKIYCHCGCTYVGEESSVIPNGEVGATVIGWDYMHYDDVDNIAALDIHSTQDIEDVVHDCKDVIKQIIELSEDNS